MIAAVMLARDEQDIIGYTVANLLAQDIDHVLVADHMSSDDTRDILLGFPKDRVTVVDNRDPGFYQDRMTTGLAEQAAAMGADWVLPCDADEFWYSPSGTVADWLGHCDAGIVIGHGWDHLATDDDDINPNPFVSMTQRRRRPQKFGKVVFRPHPDMWVDHGNHDVFNHPGQRTKGLLYRHFQYRSFEQMCRKVRAGKAVFDASDLHPMYGAHWRADGALSTDELWGKWRRLCEEPGLIDDPAPLR